MEFTLSKGDLAQLNTDCILIGAFKDASLATSWDKAIEEQISKTLKLEKFTGKPEETVLIRDLPGIKAPRLLVMGLGAKDTLTARQYRKTLLSAFKALNATACTKAHFCITDITVKDKPIAWNLRQAILLAGDCAYKFNQFKKTPETPQKPKLEKLSFSVSGAAQTELDNALREGCAIVNGMQLTKDLGNTPPNVCTPTYLAQSAKDLAKRHSSLSCKIIEEKALKEMGAGAFIAVSQGSQEPGKLILLTYKGMAKKTAPMVLVGKGITFDTGGISLKPGAKMDEMKYDMCGAASVLGVMQAVAELKLPIHLIGVIAAAENMPSGSATRPGDIVKTLSGQTVEILNTDAEGRLVLCDALTYIERFKPETVIDIATLTGACIVALGNVACGVLGNDESLVQALLTAGEDTQDRAWQLPLWEEYEALLESPFADIANIGSQSGGAGTITAAAFLSKFTKSYKWAHLDIAGTAWNSGSGAKGATGRPVPLLTQYLIAKAQQ